MPIRAVLFDLDDTLNDRAASWLNFARLLVAEGHVPIDCDAGLLCQTILGADAGGYRAKGELFADLARQIPWLNPRTPEQIELLWRERFPACIATRDGAREVLAFLRLSGLRLGIVTNGRQDMQSAKIDAMGLASAVNCTIISGAVGVKKPDPRIYKLALEALGVAAWETLFVGDHFHLDVEAPRAVGMKTAWLGLGRGWRDDTPPPEYSINALSDLIAIFTAGSSPHTG